MKRLLFVVFAVLASLVSCSTGDGAVADVACDGGACAPPVDPGVKHLGEGCQSADECSSTLCVQVAQGEGAGTKVCSVDCSAQGCPVGWQCGAVGARRACLCTKQPELCDGQDNDCDGVVDGPGADSACGAAHAGEVCREGRCTCLLPCGDRCVDPRHDSENCGACGKTCGGFGTCNEGACTCNPGATLCKGACIVTANDPQNCGACGTKCAAGEACFAGKCECRLATCGGKCADTTSDRVNCSECGKTCAGDCHDSVCEGQTLVTGQINSDFLTANDTDLFWINKTAGQVQRCPLADCSAATLVTLDTLTGAAALAAAGRYVFWGNAQVLRRFDATTQTIATVATGTNVAAIATDDSSVFWRDAGAKTILQCALDGDCTTGATTIASGLASGKGKLVASGGQLYFDYQKGYGSIPGYTLSDQFGIHACPTSGCASSPPPSFWVRASNGQSVLQLGIADGRVYWVAGDPPPFGFPFGTVWRESCPVSGCNGAPMAIVDVQELGAFEDKRIYWVDLIPQKDVTLQHRLFSCEVGERVMPDSRRVVQCVSPTVALRTAVPVKSFFGTNSGRPRTQLVLRNGFVYYAEPAGSIRRVEKL